MLRLMIIVTGATGKLGHHVVQGLLKKVPAREIGVVVRSAAKAKDLAALGVDVRVADYTKPETLASALQGADKLLLISSNELGQRLSQHQAVVEAAKKASVGLIVYTSILHANTGRISLAPEHRGTEELIRGSKIPFVFLRNGWYLENYTENLAPALEHGALAGASGEGRIAAAARADYAAAAVEVLTGKGHENKIYELAGDHPFTKAELAAEVARQSGKPVAYQNLSAEAYEKMLASVGLPGPVASMLADADVAISRGELDDKSGDLHRLIGRGTTTLAEAIRAAL